MVQALDNIPRLMVTVRFTIAMTRRTNSRFVTIYDVILLPLRSISIHIQVYKMRLRIYTYYELQVY